MKPGQKSVYFTRFARREHPPRRNCLLPCEILRCENKFAQLRDGSGPERPLRAMTARFLARAMGRFCFVWWWDRTRAFRTHTCALAVLVNLDKNPGS